MDRIEFINRTCMDDEIRRSILECFWDQYMLVYKLSDEIEQVIPMTIAINQGNIAFQLVYSNQEGVNRLRSLIDSNGYFDIYQRQFKISYWHDTNPNIITITIE